MKLILLLPLLLGLMSPAIAHNENNGGDAIHKPKLHLHYGEDPEDNLPESIEERDFG